MRRAERLFRLVNEMRSRGVTKASDLATHFEISISTVYRDIAHLQASGLPIEGEAGIGYLLRPGFDLPNVTFTYDQIDALAVGLAYVETTGDPALAAAAREARAKIQASLPNPEDRKLADAPYRSVKQAKEATGVVTELRDAIRNRLVVAFSYQNAQGLLSERRVRPLVIWNMTEGWMFSGWCELRQDFRTFRFDRIGTLTVTTEQFDEGGASGLRAFTALLDADKR
ncbi:MAG: YafY family protein [Sulfitobacter sp.]